MGEVFNKQLQGNVRGNIWETMKREAADMTPMDKAQLGADIAGIFDPTPASDTVGAGLALARRDWWGAGASVLGYIPYVGDLAKIGKIGRMAPKTAEMLKLFMKGSDNLARAGADILKKHFSFDQIIAARRAAAKRTRELMNRKRRDPNCRECQRVNRSNMPIKGGKWNTPDGKPPTSGSGTFTFDQPRTLPNGTKIDSIEFRDGFPNFDPYVHPSGKHDLWQISGNANTDAAALAREHGIRPPGQGWTLHHFENGQVGYVPSSLNNTISHAGGNSIVNNDVY
jgi:hypothetical protein